MRASGLTNGKQTSPLVCSVLCTVPSMLFIHLIIDTEMTTAHQGLRPCCGTAVHSVGGCWLKSRLCFTWSRGTTEREREQNKRKETEGREGRHYGQEVKVLYTYTKTKSADPGSDQSGPLNAAVRTAVVLTQLLIPSTEVSEVCVYRYNPPGKNCRKLSYIFTANNIPGMKYPRIAGWCLLRSSVVTPPAVSNTVAAPPRPPVTIHCAAAFAAPLYASCAWAVAELLLRELR